MVKPIKERLKENLDPIEGYNRLLGYTQKQVKVREDAEDILSNSYLTLYEKKREKVIKDEFSYLFNILKFGIKNYFRDKGLKTQIRVFSTYRDTLSQSNEIADTTLEDRLCESRKLYSYNDGEFNLGLEDNLKYTDDVPYWEKSVILSVYLKKNTGVVKGRKYTNTQTVIYKDNKLFKTLKKKESK